MACADVIDAMYANTPADEQHIQRLSANCLRTTAG
jgi:hypothetical protein